MDHCILDFLKKNFPVKQIKIDIMAKTRKTKKCKKPRVGGGKCEGNLIMFTTRKGRKCCRRRGHVPAAPAAPKRGTKKSLKEWSHRHGKKMSKTASKKHRSKKEM
jgi:hypothetical protein